MSTGAFVVDEDGFNKNSIVNESVDGDDIIERI